MPLSEIRALGILIHCWLHIHIFSSRVDQLCCSVDSTRLVPALWEVGTEIALWHIKKSLWNIHVLFNGNTIIEAKQKNHINCPHAEQRHPSEHSSFCRGRVRCLRSGHLSGLCTSTCSRCNMSRWVAGTPTLLLLWPPIKGAGRKTAHCLNGRVPVLFF